MKVSLSERGSFHLKSAQEGLEAFYSIPVMGNAFVSIRQGAGDLEPYLTNSTKQTENFVESGRFELFSTIQPFMIAWLNEQSSRDAFEVQLRTTERKPLADPSMASLEVANLKWTFKFDQSVP